MFAVFRSKARETRMLKWYKSVPEDPATSDEALSKEREETWLPARPWRTTLLTSAWWIAWSSVGFAGLLVVFLLVSHHATNSTPPHFSPDLPFDTPTPFVEDLLYQHPPSTESNAAWDKLMPAGIGFILVEHPEKYNLSGGMPTDGGPDGYSVSMFHQLHCLAMVRKSFYAALDGKKADVLDGLHKLPGDTPEAAHTRHIGHCFDYLRQALMCAGDMTMESYGKQDTHKQLGTDITGWKGLHMCRSWDAAFKWAMDHKAPDKADKRWNSLRRG